MIQVVAIYELPPIYLGNEDEALKFRVEVFLDQKTEKLFPRLYRWETFTLRPTFHETQADFANTEELADHEILVRDPVISEEDFSGDSVQEIMCMVVRRIEEITGTIK